MKSRSATSAQSAQHRNAGHDDPAAYDRLRHGWLNRRRRQYFADAVAETRPSRVVELGSGTGRMLCELAAGAPCVGFVGVEPVEGYVNYGRSLAASSGRSNVELFQGTGEQIAEVVEPGSADLIVSSDVLHHVDSLSRVIRAVRTIARPGATWVLVEPSAANPYVGAYQALTPGERNFWARRFLHEADQAGWELSGRGRMFLIPATIDCPPSWLIALERRLERFPVLAGAVTMRLTAR